MSMLTLWWCMLKSEALLYFKTNRAIALALGIDESAVSKWGEKVPPLRAYQIKEYIESAGGTDSEPIEFPKEAA